MLLQGFLFAQWNTGLVFTAFKIVIHHVEHIGMLRLQALHMIEGQGLRGAADGFSFQNKLFIRHSDFNLEFVPAKNGIVKVAANG